MHNSKYQCHIWQLAAHTTDQLTSPRLKTMFNLSPVYSAHRSSNHNLSINQKSVLTQIYIRQNKHKHQTQNFSRISPFGITPVQQALKARTRWYPGENARNLLRITHTNSTVTICVKNLSSVSVSFAILFHISSLALC